MNGRTIAPRPPSEQFWRGLTPGWYTLGFAFPPVGVVLLAVLLAKDGGVEPNRFGVSPKYF